MIGRPDFEWFAGTIMLLLVVLAMTAMLTSCAWLPTREVQVPVEVKVPYPVNCTQQLPELRTTWPIDAVMPGERDLRVIVKAMAEDDAAWRDYARAFEAATAGCR